MKVSETVRDILAECTVEGNVLMLPEGIFKESGTMVKTYVVKIRKAA